MKLIIFSIFAFIATISAFEDYNGVEYQPIDWSRVIDPTEYPGFWDQTIFPKPSVVNVRDRRIVNGNIVTPHSHPYKAALLLVRGTGTFLCGSSIITTRTVLTAAHCLIDVTQTIVIAGAHNMVIIEPTQQRRAVTTSDYRIHANYNPTNLNNDIATIIIPPTLSPFILTPQIQLVRLAEANAGLFVGENGLSVGWGRTEAGTSSPVLRSVENTIISNAACTLHYSPAIITADVICVDTSALRGTCQGDSGGVLSVQIGTGARTQVGITSFGHPTGCMGGRPAGYERITTQLPWIRANQV